MSKHTPGPWRNINGDIVGKRPDSNLPLMVCEVMLPIHNGLEHEMKAANARLIAAAPEMLAILKELTAQEDWYQEDVPAESPVGRAYAIIAKIEGA